MSAIHVQQFSKYFGAIKAVDDVTFHVAEGEIFGLLGPNGAGKTTAIRCMMDFLRPTKGSIQLLGLDAQKDSVRLKEAIGYVSGSVRLYEHWTGHDHIEFVSRLRGVSASTRELLRRLDFDPTRRCKELSSGNRQKLGLLLALLNSPKLLIFDEPTNGLDPLLQKEVYDILREQQQKGVTVLLSSHNLPEVERVCDRVAIIRAGKLVATDSISHLRQQRLYTVRVEFQTKPLRERIVLDGVDVIDEFSNGYLLTVKGSINTFVERIASYPISDLEISRANLEQIFLEFYEGDV